MYVCEANKMPWATASTSTSVEEVLVQLLLTNPQMESVPRPQLMEHAKEMMHDGVDQLEDLYVRLQASCEEEGTEPPDVAVFFDAHSFGVVGIGGTGLYGSHGFHNMN